jgi:[ribosomal protein S5]-alanine N-acetyltransferase
MIETDRLIIKPLTYDQLCNHLNSPEELAAELQIIPSKYELDKVSREAIIEDLLPNLQNPELDFRFYTMWIVIEKCSRKIAGRICFHGEPDVDDEIEIGYGIEEDCRNRGIMTESIEGLVRWLRINKIARILKAETEYENISSIKVLEKNNFEISEIKEKTFVLKLEL